MKIQYCVFMMPALLSGYLCSQDVLCDEDRSLLSEERVSEGANVVTPEAEARIKALMAAAERLTTSTAPDVWNQQKCFHDVFTAFDRLELEDLPLLDSMFTPLIQRAEDARQRRINREVERASGGGWCCRRSKKEIVALRSSLNSKYINKTQWAYQVINYYRKNTRADKSILIVEYCSKFFFA